MFEEGKATAKAIGDVVTGKNQPPQPPLSQQLLPQFFSQSTPPAAAPLQQQQLPMQPPFVQSPQAMELLNSQQTLMQTEVATTPPAAAPATNGGMAGTSGLLGKLASFLGGSSTTQMPTVSNVLSSPTQALGSMFGQKQQAPPPQQLDQDAGLQNLAQMLAQTTTTAPPSAPTVPIDVKPVVKDSTELGLEEMQNMISEAQ